MNKIVARYSDGKILKGFTSDFAPNKAMFHHSTDNNIITEIIFVNKLKAVFIVKEFEGKPGYRETSDFNGSQGGYGAKLRVHFKDGEKLIGIGMGFNPDKIGFFITPCDPNSNTIRAFVVNEFVDHIDKV
mgnify:CR=1 FL=1